MDLAPILATAKTLAYEAGQILRDFYEKPLESEHKGTIDLVTEADRTCEAFLVEALKREFPEIGIIGEEGSDYRPNGGQPEYWWFVDPLDGTTNFAHKLPHFSVLLALTTADFTPILGVVYDPLRDECFYAYQGGGAFLNERKITVSKPDAVVKALLVTGFPYDRHTSPENNLTEFNAMKKKAQGIRRFGSAGLDLAYVACGRFDGYWEQKLNRWDAYAGIIIVREAGGLVTDYQGSEAGLKEAKIQLIASNGPIHAEMQGIITEARRDLSA